MAVLIKRSTTSHSLGFNKQKPIEHRKYISSSDWNLLKLKLKLSLDKKKPQLIRLTYDLTPFGGLQKDVPKAYLGLPCIKF